VAILTGAEISLDGNLRELERLSVWIAEFCSANGLDSDVEFDLNLVLEELFTNSLRHGGCDGVPGAVQVRLEAVAGGVSVEYADRGSAFNPLELPDPDVSSPLMERRPGGLGVFMVRRVMRDLRYDRRGESNRITMTRRIEIQ
jgi:anti-sigma regulatory factor (Ser/Thr protein kinase)